MTGYEKEYQRCEAACGEPFEEFIEFFNAAPAPLSVLDLGCGQGRDALAAARHGHSVLGIDLAASGIAQLTGRAAAECLDVRCEVADIEDFDADHEYDVVVLDRVLHMLRTDARRIAMLKRAQQWVTLGGHVLVSDTKGNRGLIRKCFGSAEWEPVLAKGNNFFVRRRAGHAAQQGDIATASGRKTGDDRLLSKVEQASSRRKSFGTTRTCWRSCLSRQR